MKLAQKVTGSTPSRGAIKSTTGKSTQPSIHPGRQIQYQPAWLGLGGTRSLFVSGGR